MSVFVKDTLERALKTFVQVVLTFFIGDVTVLSVDWGTALAVAGTATLVSVLTSIATNNFFPAAKGTASLVPEVVATPTVSTTSGPRGGYPGTV